MIFLCYFFFPAGYQNEEKRRVFIIKDSESAFYKTVMAEDYSHN